MRISGSGPCQGEGIGGRFKEGVRGLARPWLPLLIKNIKASAFKNFPIGFLNPLRKGNSKALLYKKFHKDEVFILLALLSSL